MRTMVLSSLCLLLWMVFESINGDIGECHNVPTSEGVRILQHQQTACAPLKSGENVKRKGLRYVMCNHGDVSVKECPSSLRYDTVTKICVKPHVAKCQTLQHKICSTHNCKLPNCFCYGSRPDIPVRDTPQFVMVTFDDSVTTLKYEAYFKDAFFKNVYRIFNPSGCPLRATFFVSIMRTNVSAVLRLWEAGHEIASHTIHHHLPDGVSAADYAEVASEINGMRQEMLKALNNKTVVDSVIGFRAPYLKVAHNIQFDVLRDFHFLYDSSFINYRSPDKPPLWPFTLDFQFTARCGHDPCPTKIYPGLWEIMLNDWQREDGHVCSMVDGCIKTSHLKTATQRHWEDVFSNNFNYFYKYKVPMPFFAHATIFQRSPTSFPAMINWLKRLTTSHSDVWLVTPQQVLNWMKNPVTNEQMKSQRWGC